MSRFFFLLFAFTSFAFSQVADTQIITTKLPPEGLWSVIYSQVNFSTNQFYDSEQAKFLGNKVDRSLQFTDVVNEQKGIDKEVLKSLIESKNISMNESSGQVNAIIDSDTKVQVYTVFRGFKNNWLATISAVKINQSFSIDKTFLPSTQLSTFLNNLVADGNYHQVEKAISEINNSIDKKLSDNNYRPLESNQYDYWGDVQLSLRKSLTPSSVLSLISNIPTSRGIDTRDFLMRSLETKQFDIGLEYAHAKHLSSKAWTWLNSFRYMAQLPAKTAYRIPLDDTLISADEDSQTRYDLGDYTTLKTQLSYKFNEFIDFTSGLEYTLRGRDRFSGNKYETSRYNFLEDQTSGHLGAALFNVKINNINHFVRTMKFIPMMVDLYYSQTLLGKNYLKGQVFGLNIGFFYK